MLAQDPHYQRSQQEAAEVAQELRRQGHDRNMRIATWMLVGNGAALLATFNAMVSGSLCDWSQVKPFALVFLVGIVAAVGGVISEGEATSRVLKRLILLGGTSQRLAICIDANSRLHAERANLPSPNEALNQQIAENDRVIVEDSDLLERQGKEPKVELWLRRTGSVLLMASGLCFGGSIFAATISNTLLAALCK